jgi:nucleoside 2-deoxyribosyltransferase
MEKTLNIYLAGKVSGKKWDVVKQFKEDARFNFIASDGSKHSEHNYGLCDYSFKECNDKGMLADLVYDYFQKEVLNCHYLLAYLDTNDSYGSIAEIAYASALGIPCYLIIKRGPYKYYMDHDFRPMDEDGRFDAYWFVSSFKKVSNIEVKSEEEAIIEASKILERLWSSKYSNSKKFLSKVFYE